MTTGPEDGFRCSALSRGNGESQAGTASTVTRFLLVECSGPWGRDAVRDSRLPSAVKARLRTLERDTGIRPLLLRRPGRSADSGTRVFAAYAGTAAPWLQTTLLDTPDLLVDLDLSALGGGRRPGWTDVEGPLFAVCAHGRHDACCAERGRPVAAALAEAAPDATWQVSHIGGDRFAANVLVLPDGLYYGRVEPEDAAGLVASHADGRLDLEHLRGRTTAPFPVQAAEIALRRHLAEDRATAVRLVDHARDGAVTTVRFAVEDRAWRVRISTGHGSPCQLTCRATSEGTPPTHEVLELVDVNGSPVDGASRD